MEQSTNLFFKSQFATQYDSLVKKQNWYGVEVLFGLIFEYLRSGEKILDMGIGTGLSAENFHAADMEVYGLDYSSEMLEVCRQKDIAVDLKQFDLNDVPLPYPADSFDHVSANAVLYFLEELDNLFGEVSRIIKKDGIWSFIVEEHQDLTGARIIEKPRAKNGLINFRHGQQYILQLLQHNNFTILKRLEFTAENFQMQGEPVSFVAYICKA